MAACLKKVSRGPPLPSLALLGEHGEGLRRLRPAHWLGNEKNFVVLFQISKMAVDLDDNFQVLADRAVAVAAYCNGDVAAENAERPENEHQGVHPAPRQARHEEGAQIFHGLQQGQGIGGQADRDDASGADGGAVGQTDRSPDGDDPFWIVDEGLDDAQQGIRLQDGIRVDGAKEGHPSQTDPGIQGVGLAPVLLVDDQ